MMMSGGYTFPGGLSIYKDGVLIGNQPALNMTDSGNVTIVAVNNSALGRVDVNWNGSATGTGDLFSLLVPFTFASASPIVVGGLNPGDTVITSYVAIEVAFDDPTATAMLGITATPDLFLGAIKIQRAYEYSQPATYTTLAETNVQLSLVPGASTAGSGYVLILIRRA